MFTSSICLMDGSLICFVNEEIPLQYLAVVAESVVDMLYELGVGMLQLDGTGAPWETGKQF